MDIDAILDKLKAHNTDVIGCIVFRDGQTRHNLREPYDVLDAGTIGERAENLLDLMGELQDAAGEITEGFFEMEAHSLYTRRISDAVLVLVNKSMNRSAFRKAQIGVNLFVKPLGKAIDAQGVQGDTIPVVTAPPKEKDPPKKPVRYYRGVRY